MELIFIEPPLAKAFPGWQGLFGEIQNQQKEENETGDYYYSDHKPGREDEKPNTNTFYQTNQKLSHR